MLALTSGLDLCKESLIWLDGRQPRDALELFVISPVFHHHRVPRERQRVVQTADRHALDSGEVVKRLLCIE